MFLLVVLTCVHIFTDQDKQSLTGETVGEDSNQPEIPENVQVCFSLFNIQTFFL